MADKIRVNYPALEEMAKHCDQSAQRLQQTAALAGKLSAQMQNGALQGEFGDTFVQALGVLQQKVNKLAAKFTEEAGDIRGAMSDMRSADQQAGGKF
jgi:WXG100 family type VII secretion target